MWIYIFGSFVRGEIDSHSDIDMLCVHQVCESLDLPNNIQIYTIEEVKNIFLRGDLFAHHLHLESRLIYTSDGTDVLKGLSDPEDYNKWHSDFEKFNNVAQYAVDVLQKDGTDIFFKGILYMALRDMSMIYSYKHMGMPNFSKYAPFKLDIPLNIPRDAYELLRKCRLASTRGYWNDSLTSVFSTSLCVSIAKWIENMSNWSKNNA